MNQVQLEQIQEFSGANNETVQIIKQQSSDDQEFPPKNQVPLPQQRRQYFQLRVNYQLGTITTLWFLLTSNIVVIALDYSQKELFWISDLTRATFFFYMAWSYQQIYHHKCLSWPLGTNSKYSLFTMGITCFCLLLSLLPSVMFPAAHFSIFIACTNKEYSEVMLYQISKHQYGNLDYQALSQTGIILFIIIIKFIWAGLTDRLSLPVILFFNLLVTFSLGSIFYLPIIRYIWVKKCKNMGRFQKRYLKYCSQYIISFYSYLFIVLIHFCHKPSIIFVVLLLYSCLCFKALQFIIKFKYEMVRIKNKITRVPCSTLISTASLNTTIAKRKPLLSLASQVDLLTIFQRTYPEQLCSICCLAVSNIIFMQCQHYCLCSGCLKKQCIKEYFLCPICSKQTGIQYRLIKFNDDEKFMYQKGGYEIQGYLNKQQYFYEIKSRIQITE